MASAPDRAPADGVPVEPVSQPLRAGLQDRADPGIIETSLVLSLAFLLAVGILVFFGGAVADVIGLVVDAAHQGR